MDFPFIFTESASFFNLFPLHFSHGFSFIYLVISSLFDSDSVSLYIFSKVGITPLNLPEYSQELSLDFEI